MEFVEVVKETAEKTDEYQEVSAITCIHYMLFGLVGVPEGWNEEVRPLILKELGKLIKSVMESDDLVVWSRQSKEGKK